MLAWDPTGHLSFLQTVLTGNGADLLWDSIKKIIWRLNTARHETELWRQISVAVNCCNNGVLMVLHHITHIPVSAISSPFNGDIKTSWNTELQFLWAITWGQCQTTACKMYRLSRRALNIKERGREFLSTVWIFIVLTCIFASLSVQLRLIHSWNPQGGKRDDHNSNAYVLLIIFIWFGLLLQQSAGCSVIAELFRWEACGDFSSDRYKLLSSTPGARWQQSRKIHTDARIG